MPKGSLRVADNVYFSAPGVIEPRRGFDELSDSEFGDADSVADAIAFYGSLTLLAYDFTRIAIRPSTGGFFNWGETFTPNGANRMRFEPAARSIFFNPASGIHVFDGEEGFSTGVCTDASLRALDYSGGAGDLLGSSEIVGDTSGAAGTVGIVPISTTAGTLFFSLVTGGPFQDGEGLTGDAGWTADAESVDYPALVITGAATEFIPGRHIGGETSGASGVIVMRQTSGGDTLIGLSTVVGTFQAENIAVGTSTLEPLMAGCPQGLNVVAINRSGDGWQDPDTAVAYRFTICRKDAFGRIIEGPPSGRTTLRNLITIPVGLLERDTNTVDAYSTPDPSYLVTGDVVTLRPGEANFAAGAKTLTDVPAPDQAQYSEMGPDALNTVVEYLDITRSATLTLYLPDDVTQENFIRVYRSEMTVTATDVPSDELFQCYESAFLSEAQVTTGVLTFDDVTPEAVLEVPLYTNPNTGDGSLAANFRPPSAEDIVYWQNQMWFLNTTEKHSAQLAMLGVGSPDGIQVGDKLVFVPAGGVLGVDDITFTGINPGTPAPGQFQVFLFGDPGYNIQRTAQSLAQAINDSTEDGCPYACYVSSETGQPGKLLLQARDIGDADGFSVYSSRATPWAPQLPSNTVPLWPALVSTNNRHAARLFHSKPGQPEAVPLLSYEQIDADNNEGLRLAPLNYRLIVFKTDGIYFVPTGGGFQKLSDYVLIAPDSVQRLGDSVFFLSDQGLAVVDDAGVRLIDVAISSTLSALNASVSIDDLRERSVGIAYRSMEQYLLWTIEKDELDEFSDDTEQAFVFSRKANGFTRYTFGIRCGVVDKASDKLFVCPTDDNRIWVERKSLTPTDFYDVGETAIETSIIFNDFTDEQPAAMKLGQQCSFLFKENSVSQLIASFASEVHPTRVEVELNTSGWGGFSWGEEPWGGWVRTIRRVQPLPMAVANCCQLSVGLSASIAGVSFQFLGVDLQSKPDSTVNRG